MNIRGLQPRTALAFVAVILWVPSLTAVESNHSFAGTWEGKMNDLPGMDVKIDEADGKISGAVVFYFQERPDPKSPWHVAAESSGPMLAPHVEGKILTFEVQHHKCHTCAELGPNVKFRMELVGSNEARLWKLDEEETDKDLGPGLLLVRRSEPISWRDPSPHRVEFVTVEEGVRLEVLDWGGSGWPVVLLAGSGCTAHIYDDFAPKLHDLCHVYAITRRGSGLSSHPASGYTDQRLADDVLQVIDSLKIEKPVLVGHSMAGSELTTLGNQHSDRLSGLVYLDAGADPADWPWDDPAYRAVVQKLAPATPPPPSRLEVDRKKSYEAFRAWQMESLGFAFCEAEVRNEYDFNADRSIGAFRTPDSVHDAIDKGSKKRDYSSIHVPVLSIFATPLPPAEELKKHPRQSPEEREAVEQAYAILMKYIGRYEKSLQRGVPNARILEWPGATHYLFISNEAEVLRELRAFVAGLH